MIFKGDKKPQHAFLRRGRKAIDSHVVRFHDKLKTLRSMNKKYFEDQIHHILRQFILPYYEMTGGTSARALVEESGVFPYRCNFQNGSPCSYIT
jgi:hypothetical protein